MLVNHWQKGAKINTVILKSWKNTPIPLDILIHRKRTMDLYEKVYLA